MPTVLTHAVLGGVGVKAYSSWTGKKASPRLYLAAALCSMLPDADVIGFYFGIPYGHFFGHRGFFHSLCFALLLALMAAEFWMNKKNRPARVPETSFLLFLITATHPLTDAMTNGGLGIAFFSPFETSRYFLPFRPIEVASLSLKGFFTERGLRVLVSEITWVWGPALLALVLVMLFSRKKAKS